tara:strand:- start:448 stop:1116 length:669 start_codon:yes stop_codon:yes gene_type:complete
MGAAGGPFITSGIEAKRQLPSSQNVLLRSRDTGEPIVELYCDVSDADNSGKGWFLVENAFPRATNVYLTEAVGSNPPSPSDSTMSKVTDDIIRTVLNNGDKETRTQWFHTSEAYGTVWADGSLGNTSTMYNLFEYPDNWNSVGGSSGQRYKRRQGPNSSYGGEENWITSAGSGCSGAVGGWSNYYGASCVISWFAGCEGAPAYNHCCACPVDRASQLIIWVS